MVAGRILTQREQFLKYRNVVITMMGMPVYIRLLDVAEDKAGEVFNAYGGHVEAPYSGAKFLLSWPELMQTQARAIAGAAAYGPVRVIYPMISDADQFAELKRLVRGALNQDTPSQLLHGAMIEQPSACRDAERILRHADFASLGTNDLTRLILNVDRATAMSSPARLTHSQELWDAIAHVAEVATRLGKELTVCGEMASDLRLTKRFMSLGIRTFSMDVKKIKHFRRTESMVPDGKNYRKKSTSMH
jgi:phosphotransferase system enzyme I (PtsI)